MAKKDRKDSILNAAEALFAVHGYDGTSTRAIAERSGANLALLAYYFGSKEGVFEATVARRASALLERVRGLAEPGEAPWVRLSRYLEESIQFLVADHPDFSRILLRESTGPVGSEHTGSPLRASTRPLREVLMRIQAAGRAGGEFKYVDVDLSLHMLLGIALFSAAEVSGQSPSELSSLSRRATDLATAAFRGLLAREGASVDRAMESPPLLSERGEGEEEATETSVEGNGDFEIGEVD